MDTLTLFEIATLYAATATAVCFIWLGAFKKS